MHNKKIGGPSSGNPARSGQTLTDCRGKDKNVFTDAERAEDPLRRLNRTLQVVSACNRALVRAKSEEELLHDICQTISDGFGNAMVWVGYAEHDAARTVHIAAQVIRKIDREIIIPALTWDDSGRGRGATGTAIRTGKLHIKTAAERGRYNNKWWDCPKTCDICSIAAFPLKNLQGTFGALSLCSSEVSAFGEQEAAVLEELADDLAFGIDVLRARDKQQLTEEMLRLRNLAIEASNDGIMITDALIPGKPITYVNPAFELITGYKAQEAVGRRGGFLFRKDIEQPGLQEILAAMREHRECRALMRSYRKDGSQFWNELSLAPVRNEAGVLTHHISIFKDVTQRKQYEEQLERQANYDPLTGLANRNLMTDRLEQALIYARRSGRLVAVLAFDLDRFKNVNDSLGHDAGDRLLQLVSKRLEQRVREGDTVARWGGDEFIIVLADVDQAESVISVAQKLLEAVSQSTFIGNHEITPRASIGISLYPRDAEDRETLLRNADTAMHRAKDAGRNTFAFYTQDQNQRAIARLELEAGLHRALERRELLLHYQPKVDLQTGAVLGSEALLRWKHPDRGMIPPIEFIPVAEETGLILPIGAWVLETACVQAKAWQKAGWPRMTMAVNLSARQFQQKDLVKTVTGILARTGFDPASLDLEITESMLMRDPEAAAATISRLHAMGVRLSMDDFGTGYSSLGYLKRFEVDNLKIDRSFVRDIPASQDDAAIVRAIISLAQALKMKVIAEGVETEEQKNFLAALGCDEYQGFYFSKPLPPEEFEALLRKHSAPG